MPCCYGYGCRTFACCSLAHQSMSAAFCGEGSALPRCHQEYHSLANTNTTAATSINSNHGLETSCRTGETPLQWLQSSVSTTTTMPRPHNGNRGPNASRSHSRASLQQRPDARGIHRCSTERRCCDPTPNAITPGLPTSHEPFSLNDVLHPALFPLLRAHEFRHLSFDAPHAPLTKGPPPPRRDL